MKKVLIIMLIAITGIYGKIAAQQPAILLSDKTGWQKIAETTADLKKDHDEVVLIGANRFSNLQFKVTDGAIDFMHTEIYYDKGDSQRVVLSSPITAPGETRVIQVQKGIERDIKKIVFVYKTLPNRKDEKAHVEIWGLKANINK